jgi:demethylmacrocin O-methyltransferase
MKTLDEIAIHRGTDKASIHPTGAHDYARHYDEVFSPLRKDPLKILEIGVGGGESIMTWLDYFPNATVFGVDINSNTNQWNSPDEDIVRYRFVQGDQSSAAFWETFLQNHHGDWDIIIDDGGHFADQVIQTYRSLWDSLRPGGLYCIEDIGVSYGAGSVFLKEGWPSHIDFMRERLDWVNQNVGIDWMRCSKELMIFKKAQC